MSIRYKLFLVMTAVLSLAGILAFFAVRTADTTGDLVVRLYDGPLIGINHARSAQAELNDARALMQAGLVLREGAPKDTITKLESHVAQALDDLRIVRERIKESALLAAVGQAEATINGWFRLGLKVLNPAAEGVTELPMASDVASQGEAAVAAIDNLVELVAAYGFEFRQTADETVQSTRKLILALSGAMGIVGLLLAVGLAYSLSRPIRAAMGVAERVASGNFTDRIDVKRRDELGRLLASLAAMQVSLKARADDELASHELKERARAEQEAEKRQMMAQLASMFEAKVGTLVLSFESAATEMEATARSMSVTAEETNSRAEIVASCVEETATNMNTAASSTEELAASTGEIGSLVTTSSTMVSRAVETTRETDSTVARLADGAQKIGDIVQLITKIAAQTNLLALNATIEAARAGAAGKGFAVVATEVKSLAAQTAVATQQIESQIAEICSATSEAVQAIRSIAGTIDDVSTTATTITGAIHQQQIATREIARNVSEASRSTQAVTVNMEEVRQAAAHTGAAASQVLGSATELAHNAQTLSRELAEFLRNVRAA
jgi:methyl-accepting chemotaxis protein